METEPGERNKQEHRSPPGPGILPYGAIENATSPDQPKRMGIGSEDRSCWFGEAKAARIVTATLGPEKVGE